MGYVCLTVLKIIQHYNWRNMQKNLTISRAQASQSKYFHLYTRVDKKNSRQFSFFLCVTEQQTISKSTFHYQYDSWHEYTATTACVEKSIQNFCDWCWLFFFVASYNNNNKIEIERYSEWFCVHKIIIGFEWNFEM